LAFDVVLGWGVKACTNFRGTSFIKIWQGKKRSKIGAIHDNFGLSANISEIDEDSNKI